MKRSNKSKFQLGGRTENGSLPRHNKLAQYGMSNDSVKSYESPTIAGDGIAAEVSSAKASGGVVTGVVEGAQKAIEDVEKENEVKDSSKKQMIPPPDVITQPEAAEEQKQKEIDTSDVYNQVARVSQSRSRPLSSNSLLVSPYVANAFSLTSPPSSPSNWALETLATWL